MEQYSASKSTDLQGELEALRPVYEKSKMRLAGQDQEWKLREERLRTEMYRLIKGYLGQGTGAEASFILGQLRSAVFELDAPRMNVLDYEGKRKEYVRQSLAAGKKPTQF